MMIQSTDQIGQVIHNAVVFNVKNWRGDRSASSDVVQTVRRLFSILEQRNIDYAVIGEIALLCYVEARNTQDLDLLMSVSSLDSYLN